MSQSLVYGEVASPRLAAALTHLGASPGKRLRPQLVLTSAAAIGGEKATERAHASAEAVELIHTYSLVHDDLPAMDDDALRRGVPTLHIAFDEATAVLIGDGLQARAFELVANDDSLGAEQRIAIVAALAKAAGFAGMVGGQSLDMEATAQHLGLDDLKRMHALKTGALITGAMEIGGIAAAASTEQLKTLNALGNRLGLAFQIIDDVLDVRSDSATLGKTSGKDAATDKSTYVALMGLEEAEAAAQALCSESLALIADWGEDADPLRELMRRLVDRAH